MATGTVLKIKEESDQWFKAQALGENRETNNGVSSGQMRKQWKPPPEGWLKCNVGAEWSKERLIGGGTWVLRDEKGLDKLHSRRAFSNVNSKEEYVLTSLIWSIDSMKCHKLNRIIFASESVDLVGVINRPRAWPSFQFHEAELKVSLSGLVDWRLEKEDRSTNRDAAFIALSVRKEDQLHSYVSIGHPSWLHQLFEDERVRPSMCVLS